ncbi:hypothetical protein G5C33_16310 [Sphingosinithalassobacter tenebrarum]|uniref:VanZ-like domain-containing protein n=2 Tax=Stakelama tenebrarum TaxID=2711215 RepID=A0A6G6Y8C0_9SPHN|nr:hypothetical protein G5C33_16310 [Sphingosinithalassobacter tenebrarum]
MLATAYHGWIEWIINASQTMDKVWHIHAGLTILLLSRLLLRTPLRSFVPFGVVVVAELINELLDRIHFGQWRWEDTVSDAVFTLFWPLMISGYALLLSRFPALDSPGPRIAGLLRRLRSRGGG